MCKTYQNSRTYDINMKLGFDFTNFEINIIFLTKLFFYMTKKFKQKFRTKLEIIFRTKRTFKMK